MGSSLPVPAAGFSFCPQTPRSNSSRLVPRPAFYFWPDRTGWLGGLASSRRPRANPVKNVSGGVANRALEFVETWTNSLEAPAPGCAKRHHTNACDIAFGEKVVDARGLRRG